MIKWMKKFYYWGIIIGLILLGIAIYTAGARGGDLKTLLKKRPKRKKKSIKLPKKPSIVDYVELYQQKIKNL
jgi:hypothetical protein